MKLVVIFALLQAVKGVQFNYPIAPPYEEHKIVDANKRLPLNDQEEFVVNSWLNVDAAVRKFSEKILQTTLPYAFKMITTTQLSQNCTRDIVNYLRGIADITDWAFKMLDSTGKIPSGTTGGNVGALGDYFTCLNATNADLFDGNYCLVDFEIPLPKRKNFRKWAKDAPEIFNFTSSDTIIHEYLKWGEGLYMLHPRTSICIPSTCNINDAEKIVNKSIEFTGLGFSSSVKSCETRADKTKATFFDLIIISIISTITIVVILSTFLDFYWRYEGRNASNKENQSTSTNFFSILVTLPKLFQDDENPESIRIFHGMRVIAMFWIILSNICLIIYPQAYSNLEFYLNIRKNLIAQFVSSSSLAVETFFFMSATLLAYHILKDEDQKKNIGPLFFARYFRLTLPQLVVITFICILSLFSYGPLHKEIIDPQSMNCRYWGWMNLLYINNYAFGENMCLNVSWYLSVDIQLYLLSLFILVPFKRNPKTVIMLTVTLLICGLFGTLLSHIIHKLPPTTLMLNLEIDNLYYIWRRSLYLPHFHLPTYCIGLLVGYILAKKKHIHVSKGMREILWIATILAQISIIFGVFVWNKSGDYPGLLFSVLYGCSHRIIWSLSLAWITLACKTNETSVLSRFLGSNSFVPLSRLSFMMYLTHSVVKTFYVGTTKGLIYYSYSTVIYMFLSLNLFTFIISCLLTIIFVYPFVKYTRTINNSIEKFIKKEFIKGKF